jgi:N-acetylmuramoyl-L-alanine amidase
VRQGEYVSSIALDYGFLDWHTVYDHPNNAELRRKRASPDILLPGDQVFIPDKEEKHESCSTEQRHEFQIKLPMTWLNIILKDAEGRAIANQPYTLTIAGRTLNKRRTLKKTTDGTGLVQQQIPVGVTRGRLTLDNVGLSWDLRIGHLDPIHDQGSDKAIISGVQARLNNLGFLCGDVDGILGPKTRSAIFLFQGMRMGIDWSKATGVPDEDTRNALLAAHGC